MFLREALRRGSRLEDEVAAVYDNLAGSCASSPEKAAAWAELSRKERLRARMLHALSEISDALGDEGPFLVEVPLQLAGVGRAIESAKRRLQADVDGEASQQCVDALEATPRAELIAALLEVAEPELRKAIRVIDSDVRSLRRRGDAPRMRRASKARVPCSRGA